MKEKDSMQGIADVDPTERRILIVEDDSENLNLINEALSKEGYQTEMAPSAHEAFIAIRRFKPHLVLTDHDMPGLTGLEMLRQLRQQKNYVTVVFISGRVDAKVVSQALDLGADDYIRKPFRFEELLARVKACLRTNDVHRELLEANEKLQDMVDRDYLTGLFNMRSMYERIDYELKRARRYKRHVSVIMMDMDHFKSVNDSNDHLFGSFVLKEVGDLILKNMREIDFAARYGGDEFLIVLTETDQAGTEIFCNRVRETIGGHTFKDGKNKINLTVSLGYSVVKGESNIDARQLVRQADHALYDAKESGRNTVAPFTQLREKLGPS